MRRSGMIYIRQYLIAQLSRCANYIFNAFGRNLVIVYSSADDSRFDSRAGKRFRPDSANEPLPVGQKLMYHNAAVFINNAHSAYMRKVSSADKHLTTSGKD